MPHMQFKMYMTAGSRDIGNECLIKAGGTEAFFKKEKLEGKHFLMSTIQQVLLYMPLLGGEFRND